MSDELDPIEAAKKARRRLAYVRQRLPEVRDLHQAFKEELDTLKEKLAELRGR